MFAVAPAAISAPSPSVTIVRSVASTVSGPSTVTSGALPKSPETLTDFDASPDGVSMQDAPAVRAPAGARGRIRVRRAAAGAGGQRQDGGRGQGEGDASLHVSRFHRRGGRTRYVGGTRTVCPNRPGTA